MANHTADAICKLQVLTTVTELQSLLGFCCVSRRFVASFARMVSPLSIRLRKFHVKKIQFLTEEGLSALETLKETLISTPVSALMNRNERYSSNTEAFERQVGCVLL